MSTIYSIQMPAAKRQRTSILNENELLYPFELSYTHKTRNSSKTTVQINKIPQCSLIGVMKYLDNKSLNTLTRTSKIYHNAASKYKKYKQKLNDHDMIMNDLDINTNENNTNMTSLSLSLSLSLSIPTLGNEMQVPSLSLDPTHNNYIIIQQKNNIFDMDICNHLTINSHLNLHLKCEESNNTNNNEENDNDNYICDDDDIDIFENNRCSLLDILNNMENITI